MDITYLLWLQELREATGGILDGFLEGISDFVISIYAYLILAFIYWCVDKRAGMMAAMNIGIGNGINQLAKNIFCVYRPWIRSSAIVPSGNAIATAGGYSFPSSHTQVATAGFGSIAIWQRKRKWIVVLCGIMILLVMFSRNYLGVHTPQDVLAGLLLSLLVLRFNNWLIDWIEKKPGRDLTVCIIGVLFFLATLIFMTLKPYPLDYTSDGKLLVDPVNMIAQGYTGAGCAIGFQVGWILERRFVNFEVPTGWKRKIGYFALGILSIIVVVVFFCEPMKAVLRTNGDIGYYLSRFFYFAILYIYILAGFPFLLKKLEKQSSRKK